MVQELQEHGDLVVLVILEPQLLLVVEMVALKVAADIVIKVLVGVVHLVGADQVLVVVVLLLGSVVLVVA
jgi:hypothetical protein